ncbi:MAG: transcriptional repressor [Chloroflexi bacterium]|nr:transcriptional repressor [Chloroflexota bacterium]
MRSDEIIRRLRRSGYKVTPQRVSIIKTLLGSREALTPAALFQKVRLVDPTVGEVTVYRTLNILSELGLVCVVSTAENVNGYIVRPGGHHDHLICSECGKVVDFRNCNVSELEKRLASETGFVIKEHRLDLYGLCPQCA